MRTTHQIVLTDEYIAEAQRLVVAQNTMLRLVHQTWWFFWVQRVFFFQQRYSFGYPATPNSLCFFSPRCFLIFSYPALITPRLS